MSDLTIVGWSDFECEYPTPKFNSDELQEVINLIKEEIAKNGYVFSGVKHQCASTGVPVFSNGTCFRASMRAWGGIMAEIYQKPNGGSFSYMDFYMSVPGEDVLPEYEKIDVEPAKVEVVSSGCTVKNDRQIIEEAIEMGMPFLTTDKVLKKNYENRIKEKEEK